MQHRRSQRVQFPGHQQLVLSGIVESPNENPLARAIFSHCFTCGKDIKLAVRLCRRLAQNGIEVLRYDAAGVGESEGDFAQTNFATQTEDLQTAIAYFGSQNTLPLFLIGHSLGGAVALAVAQQALAVRGTITLAAPSDTYHLADTLANLDPTIEASGTGTVCIGGRHFSINKQMLEQFRQYDLASVIDSNRKPILTFHSPADQTVGYHHALKIVGLGSDNLLDPSEPYDRMVSRSLITLPGSDHLLTNNPADLPFVGDTITAWITRLTSILR